MVYNSGATIIAGDSHFRKRRELREPRSESAAAAAALFVLRTAAVRAAAPLVLLVKDGQEHRALRHRLGGLLLVREELDQASHGYFPRWKPAVFLDVVTRDAS